MLDLHIHLYGSISPEMLFEIGKNNPHPRWEIFTELHKNISGEEINTTTFFEEYKDLTRFKNLYLFNKRAPFIEFQSKFNLIIALSKFNEEEISYVAKEVTLNHSRQGVSFVEYRIMYAPNADREVYYSKTLAACKGLSEGEKESQYKIQARLVVSLHRGGDYFLQYKWLKELIKENDFVKKYLVGIDFCYIEEGFPPSDKKEFFNKILADNEEHPEYALSNLYHVGESFSDKTPKSAVRWVGQSAIWGAHRLGHCISLGINPEQFANQNIKEKVKERLEQIQFELNYFEKLKSFGVTSSYSELKKEKELLDLKNPDDLISIFVNKQYIEELYTLQQFTMYLIREESKSVIESCPTSNLLIGMLPSMADHPIKRFVDSNLRVTINTDDPGIFETNLKKEFELSEKSGLSTEQLNQIKLNSNLYTSETLSGRKPLSQNVDFRL